VSTSVRAESGVTITPPALLDIVLEELEARRALIDSVEGQATLREEYRRALVTLGQLVRVERTSDVIVGFASRSIISDSSSSRSMAKSSRSRPATWCTCGPRR